MMLIEVLNGRYGVDAQGCVYSLRNKAGNRRNVPYLMKTRRTREGYLCITIYMDGDGKPVKKMCYVHRLVAQAFIPNPMGKPQVNHIDGNKANNCPMNLEWTSASENTLHAHATGLCTVTKPWQGKFNEQHNKSLPVRQMTLDGQTVQIFPSAREAQRKGFSQGNIHSVITGKRKTHKGFLWAFA